MTANALDLTTLDNVKQWLGVQSADDDALLQRMVTAVSAYVQTWLNRSFAAATYTEIRDGNNKTRLLCANYPVLSVAGVTINGWTIAPSPDLSSVGYYFDQYMIGLRGAIFLEGESNVVISYSAGFASVPPEIEQAVIETIALRYREKDRIGHASKTLNGETVSFTIVDFPKAALTILNNYKKVVPL